MEIKLNEIGKVLKIFVLDGGAVKDLTGYTGTLQVRGSDKRQQADRSTTVTTATGLVSYTTVAGDWAAGTWLTPGTYTGTVKLVKSTTNLHYTDEFEIVILPIFGN